LACLALFAQEAVPAVAVFAAIDVLLGLGFAGLAQTA
jgi:hypothetical protein